MAESGDDYSDPDGAYGILAFVWLATTGLPGQAGDYSPATQDAAALKLYSEYGWQPWASDGPEYYDKCRFV